MKIAIGDIVIVENDSEESTSGNQHHNLIGSFDFWVERVMERDPHRVADVCRCANEEAFHDGVIHGDKICEDIDVPAEEEEKIKLLSSEGDASTVPRRLKTEEKESERGHVREVAQESEDVEHVGMRSKIATLHTVVIEVREVAGPHADSFVRRVEGKAGVFMVPRRLKSRKHLWLAWLGLHI